MEGKIGKNSMLCCVAYQVDYLVGKEFWKNFLEFMVLRLCSKIAYYSTIVKIDAELYLIIFENLSKTS